MYRNALLIALVLLAFLSADPAMARQGEAGVVKLFRYNAPPPVLIAPPPPPSSAFLTVDGGVFDTLVPGLWRHASIPGFPLPGGESATLDLERFDILSPNAVAVAGTYEGDRPFTLDRHLFFRGTLRGREGAYIYLAVFRDFCSGYIELPRADGSVDRIMIAPDDLDSPNPVTIIFNPAEIPGFGRNKRTECHAEELPEYGAQVEEVFRRLKERKDLENGASGHGILGSRTLVCQTAVECDIKYFQGQGSNLSRAANYALTVMGASSAIYQRDANVAMQVPFLRIWTATGPYTGGIAGDLLGQLRDNWINTMGHVARSNTLMLSFNVGGGVAWVGTICNDFGFAVSGLGGGVEFPAEGYQWDVDVTSHEMGHDFGSPHTHNCSWAPAIDSCVGSEGGCFGEPTPRPGSIMSYCHLNVGTRLFVHPRVATLIRLNFERALCVGPVPNAVENDIAVAHIVVPANGGKVMRGVVFNPRATVRNLGTARQINIPVSCELRSSAGNVVFTSTKNITMLDPGASSTIDFGAASIVEDGIYQTIIEARLSGDSVSLNNVMVRPFEVVAQTSGSIALTAPDGGEMLQAGSVVPITWTRNGTGDLLIELTTDNGASWSVIRHPVNGNSGRFDWTVPAYPTTTARVRIGSVDDMSINDMSDATFTIDVAKDVQPVDLILPSIAEATSTPFAPKVEVRNNGNTTLTDVPVRLRMIWRMGGNEVYNDTVVIPSIAPSSTITVDFPSIPLLPGGSHVVIARALLDGDQLPSNDSLARTADINGLAPPGWLKTRPLNRAIALTWSQVHDSMVDRYLIYRGVNNRELSLIATVRSSVRTYVDEGLENGVEYYYAISVRKGTSVSSYSPVVKDSPLYISGGFDLGAPRLILPVENAARVSIPARHVWQGPAGAELYETQIALDPQMRDIIADHLLTDVVLTTHLSFGSRYYWRARAFNNSSVGSWSPVQTFVTNDSCGGYALSFNGVDNRMQAPQFNWRDTAVTVEFWSYVAAADLRTASAFSVGTTTGGKRFQAHVPWVDGTLYWDYGDIGQNGRVTADYSPYLGKWSHVALVSNGTSFKGIYLDGELVSSATSADFPESRGNLVIGAFVNEAFHKGMVDEFRIWNRVRSAAEIRRDMYRAIDAPQPGLLGYWRFEEQIGSIVADLSGNGANGSLSHDAIWALSNVPINCRQSITIAAPRLIAPENERSYAVRFTPAFIWEKAEPAQAYELQIARSESFETLERSIPNIASTSITVPGLEPSTRYYWRVRGMHVAAEGSWSLPWSFTTSATCAANVLSFDGTDALVRVDSFALDGRAVTVEFWNYVDTSAVRNSSAFTIGRGDDNGNRFQAHVPWSDRNLYWDYGNLNDLGRIVTGYGNYLSKWTHVALVSNGIDYKAIYLDGEPVATSSTASRPSGLTELKIGGLPPEWFHPGTIDEFRIWNVARSREAIRSTMYRRLPSPQSGLIAYYGFDESGGDFAFDSSGRRHDGIFVNGPERGSAMLPLVPAIEPISGPIIAGGGSSGNIYAVQQGAGESYRWSVIGGTIASGQGTAEIAVEWSDTTTGYVTLVTEKPSGCADSVWLHVAFGTAGSVTGGRTAAPLILTATPNPASTSTIFEYDLPRDAHVRLDLFATDGSHVATLIDAHESAGRRKVPFDSRTLASGTYICRLDAGYGAYVLAVRVIK